MSGKQKSKTSSKISKLDREMNYISPKLQSSDKVKEALLKMKKDKKKSLHRRLNKGLIKSGPKKVRNIFFSNKTCFSKEVSILLPLLLYSETGKETGIISSDKHKYLLQGFKQLLQRLRSPAVYTCSDQNM